MSGLNGRGEGPQVNQWRVVLHHLMSDPLNGRGFLPLVSVSHFVYHMTCAQVPEGLRGAAE